MIERITPVILTFNESPNITRTLEKLSWAGEVVVVDSHSSDDTPEQVRAFPRTRLFQRRFDEHSRQWNWAVSETGIRTEWVLALDADYQVTDELAEELRGLDPAPDVAGYRAAFVYCILGRRLRGSVYPPVTVLYRRDRARYEQDGHTQRIRVEGKVLDLAAPILHDDRKPFSAWLGAQKRYMRLEARLLRSRRWADLGWPDRVRKLRVVAPFSVFLYCLFVQGGLLDGRAGWFYAFQRMIAETILSLNLLRADLGLGKG
jgi:glycosyltransferase involved in cell wall biosynthesis